MTGNKLLDKIIVLISFLGAASFLGVTVYRTMIYKKPMPNEQAELERLKAEARKKIFAESYKLPPLTINLPSRTVKLRFLDIEMYLVPFEAKYLETLEKFKPHIIDIIIDAASKIDPSELNTPTGKILLESRIKEKANDKIGEIVIKEILFTKFIVN
ncbi:MAG: flagellar basal body-associated FliL family protein [Bacteriovoracaceae bacterium]